MPYPLVKQFCCKKRFYLKSFYCFLTNFHPTRIENFHTTQILEKECKINILNKINMRFLNHLLYDIKMFIEYFLVICIAITKISGKPKLDWFFLNDSFHFIQLNPFLNN